MVSSPPLSRLQAKFDYVFNDMTWLEEALTHVSANMGGRSYQRLEFLGDHVLGLVVSRMLFEAFPEASEGELSRRLGELVRKESCADLARAWHVGEYIRLGEGENRLGARKNEAMLGDVCEAVIGAVYCDGGFPAAEKLVRRWWQAKMQAHDKVIKDAKTFLQEFVQARGFPVPVYTLAGRKGPDHAPLFEVAVQAGKEALINGQGASKRIAEQNAAHAWLERAGVEEYKIKT